MKTIKGMQMTTITTTIENDIVINNVTGPVALDELMDYIRNKVASWQGKPVLWEASKATFKNISTEDWKSLPRKIGHLADTRKEEKTALVASDDFPFGMLRMFEILAENEQLAIQFQTFRDINRAKAWLVSKD